MDRQGKQFLIIMETCNSGKTFTLFAACAVLVLIALLSVGPLHAQDADGFVSLFNGKNLDGWQGATEVYMVENGYLVCKKHGPGEKASTDKNLFTRKEYADFILRFEFKLEPGANNGVAVRSPLEGHITEVGMEIQILDDSAECYKNLAPHQYHGSIYLLAPAKRGHLKAVGEWNGEEIMFHGRHAKITLNGVVIVDVDLDNLEYKKYLDKNTGRKRPRGYIGFLGHGSRVEFRNIRIKEL
ncbi:MAG: DUF1080 domain-containing protein [Kiritimatiellae bacterium]|nr:DUF1080 domain-containing protein [Kiritimatiellia bacterium]MDD5522931.1 DUF1080 domain-containing protein [Kiritimatiellia bacterium]